MRHTAHKKKYFYIIFYGDQSGCIFTDLGISVSLNAFFLLRNKFSDASPLSNVPRIAIRKTGHFYDSLDVDVRFFFHLIYCSSWDTCVCVLARNRSGPQAALFTSCIHIYLDLSHFNCKVNIRPENPRLVIVFSQLAEKQKCPHAWGPKTQPARTWISLQFRENQRGRSSVLSV